MKFTTRKILAVAAVVLSSTLACAADETDAPLEDSIAEETGSSVEFLTEELDDLRVTTTVMAEGAVVELIDLNADVVVATLDWDGHSSTLELGIDDSVTSIELDSPPQVSELNAILLAQWHGAEVVQADQADAIQFDQDTTSATGSIYATCPSSTTSAPIYVPVERWSDSAWDEISHADCSNVCKNKCWFKYGYATSWDVADNGPWGFYHYAKCRCFK